MKKICLLLMLAAVLAGCSRQTKLNFRLIPVQSGGKWGYVDREGKFVINPQFEYADYFIGDLALVMSQDSKFGYINKEGNFVINAQFMYALPFSEGKACVVSAGGSPKFINEKGEVLFELKDAIMAGNFQEGLAMVENKERKWGFIGKDGNLRINYQFDRVMYFSDGLAPVMKMVTKDSLEWDQQWGYINTDGEMVINLQYKTASPFINGYAVISLDGKKMGFINTKGEIVINPQFDNASIFSEGLAAVESGDQWGFVDQSGKYVINPRFEGIRDLKNGVIGIVENGKWGFADKTGKIIINPQFDMASYFIDGIALVQSGNKFGIIDEKGKYLVSPQYEAVNPNFLIYAFDLYTGLVETDKIAPPADAAGKFLNLLVKQDYEQAAEMATTGTEWWIQQWRAEADSLKEAAEAAGIDSPVLVKIENLQCETSEGTATCTFLKNGTGDKIILIKQSGEWVIDMEGSNPDAINYDNDDLQRTLDSLNAILAADSISKANRSY